MKSMLLLSIMASSLVSAVVTLAITTVVSPRPAEAQTSPSVVTAQGFVLQDATGKVRAELGISATGDAGLNLFDADGVTRLRVYLDQAGSPGVGLLDPDLTRRVALAANPQAGAVVILRDPGIGPEGGQPFRIRLAVRNDGTANLGLFDAPDNTIRWCVWTPECR